MIFMSLFMFISYGYLAIRRKKIMLSDIIFKASLIILPTVVIFSPWLLRMVVVRIKHPEVAAVSGHSAFVADLVGLFVPDVYHLIGGSKFIKKITLKMVELSGSNMWEAAVYIGVVNLLLIIFAFRRSFKFTARYYGGFLVFLILAMGTQIRVFGEGLPIFLPYYLLKYVNMLTIEQQLRFVEILEKGYLNYARERLGLALK